VPVFFLKKTTFRVPASLWFFSPSRFPPSSQYPVYVADLPPCYCQPPREMYADNGSNQSPFFLRVRASKIKEIVAILTPAGRSGPFFTFETPSPPKNVRPFPSTTSFATSYCFGAHFFESSPTKNPCPMTRRLPAKRHRTSIVTSS